MGHHVFGEDALYLTVESLEKRYAMLDPSVSDLSFSLAQGELLGVLGPSGCGKTTTLRMISGLVPVTSGKIMVAGRNVTHLPTYKRNMGVMFQSYALFPHLTIAENIAFGLQMRNVSKSEITKRVTNALSMVKLDGVGDRKPRQLSGGQQQRVALARSLVIEPDILLLDEPLSNLDAKLRDNMRDEIREIQRRLRMTTVFVTHDQVEAMAICDRIVVMNKGKLEQIGTPFEIYEKPSTPMVADFVGRINRLSGRWTDRNEIVVGDRVIKASSGGRKGEHVLVMVRPHRIAISDGAPDGANEPDFNTLSGIVRNVTYIGDALHYEVDVSGNRITVEAKTTSDHPPRKVDDRVNIRWRVQDTLVFTTGGGNG